MKKCILLIFLFGLAANGFSQGNNGDPKLSETWEPVPPVVKPGSAPQDPPSDAVVLFNGKDFGAWNTRNGNQVGWIREDGHMTVKKGTGEIVTKQEFGDCQLHIEWRTPAVVKGEGQGRGNSGIFFMERYELQILDSYNNKTYANGQAGSIYKQLIPLANASKGPGEWQTYDVIFKAPRFSATGRLTEQAQITVIHNGVLVQNNAVLWGATAFIGIPEYKAHAPKAPLMLQDHGDAVSFRNIWIREL